MASRTSRKEWVRGLPSAFGVGRYDRKRVHSASERSVGYVFLIEESVQNHPHPYQTGSKGVFLMPQSSPTAAVVRNRWYRNEAIPQTSYATTASVWPPEPLPQRAGALPSPAPLRPSRAILARPAAALRGLLAPGSFGPAPRWPATAAR